MKRLLQILVTILLAHASFAQTGKVGIGTVTPHPSAKLDIAATEKGMLMPRMTAAQRSAIVNPALGLEVFQTNGGAPGICFYNGKKWVTQPGGLPLDSLGNTSALGNIVIFAGGGNPPYRDGFGSAAAFGYPRGLSTDRSGNIYVADASNNRVRKITSAGMVTTIGGSGFSGPAATCVDMAGNIYVADASSNRIKKITPAGTVSTLAGNGNTAYADGTGTAASFYNPTGICIDAAGNLLVADASNNRIRKVTPAGVVTTLAGSNVGYADGTGIAALFKNPSGICVDGSGNVIVTDQGNNRIRKVTPAGVVSTIAGNGTAGAVNDIGTAASFNSPTGICIDGASNLYVADYANNKIRKISFSLAVSTFIDFPQPSGIFIDAASVLYLSDHASNVIKTIVTAPRYAMLPGLANVPAINGLLTPADITNNLVYPTVLPNYLPTARLAAYARPSNFVVLARPTDFAKYMTMGTTQQIIGSKSFLKSTWISGRLNLGTTKTANMLNFDGMVAAYTNLDNYPLYQYYGPSHNAVYLALDAYYDDTWRSSSAAGNFRFTKSTNFTIQYQTGVAPGGVIGSGGWLTGISINTSGNVGIGTGSQSARLSVNGSANNSTGSWSVFSDARLKKVDSNFNDGLDVLMKIKPVRFHYKANAPFGSDKEQIGVIAQELEQAAPYMVDRAAGAGLPDLRQVDNQAYVFLLINAIKAQQGILAQQEQELIVRSQRIKALQALDAKMIVVAAQVRLLQNRKNILLVNTR